MAEKSYKLCVFCSANSGLSEAVYRAADEFCDLLKEKNGQLLYGGGRFGLMGHFADQCLKRGIRVRGATTKRLDETFETAYRGIDELIIVPDLFERKRWFLNEADAFVIFPGGIGTLDEALEVITWKSLGELYKPIIFVNVDGFWDSTFRMFDDLLAKNVLRADAMATYAVVETGRDVFTALDRSVKLD